jgi:polar amino acid transport system substrate-binding protein
MMKKFLLLAMTLLMALSLVAGCGSDSPKKMVIGLDDNFAPMGFRNEKNEIVGYDIDLAKEACKRAGMEVEFKPIDWASKEAEIKGKRIDANCFTVNPERQEAYTLSKPYMVNAQLVVVPKGSEITKIADLKGKVLAVQDDSTGSYILDRNNELRTSLKDYRKYPDFAAIPITTGIKTAAVPVLESTPLINPTIILARYYMVKHPDKYVALEENLGDEVVAVAFRKDDKEYSEKINKALDEMKKDGTMKKISEQWMGVDITKY